MSAAPDASAAKPKSKKLLVIVLGVLVLALLGALAALLLLKQNTAQDEAGFEEEPAAQHSRADPGAPPIFLPLDNMVVNLADPGGTRFVQIGITLKLQDEQTAEDIKVFMPSIRSGVLLLISQRSADEVLSIAGKEKLANDIISEISSVMGYEFEAPTAAQSERSPRQRRAAPNPVHAVLFSSFIVQ